MENGNTGRYFVELAYKGSRFHGWQIQNNAITIQSVLNKALSTLLKEPIETVGCGRTDTGVHARQFFAHFNTGYPIFKKMNGNRSISQEQTGLLKSVNALTGKDIVVKHFFPVQEQAHARFDALTRSYEYHICHTKDPFKQDLAYFLDYDLQAESINVATSILKSYRDFSSFSKSHTQTFTNNCSITHIYWMKGKKESIFYITANRFLRNMVRAIVGTLIKIGKSEILPEKIIDILESNDRSQAGESVPALGLYLTEVKYPQDIFLS